MAKAIAPKPRGPRLTKEVSVMAWILNEQGDTLLVRQAAGRRYWTLPGGKVKRGEGLLKALQREVKEETGLNVRVGELVAVMDRPEKAAVTLLFEAQSKRGRIKVRQKQKEIDDVGFGSFLPENASPSASYFWSLLRCAN